MGKKDPRIDAYIERSADFAKPILRHLRKLVHEECPAVEETVKWAFPFFMYKGIFCMMGAFKGHATFGFWHPELRRGEDVKTESSGMGQYGRLTSQKDLPADAELRKRLRQAIELHDQGVPKIIRKRVTEPIEIPSALSAALAKNAKARKQFAAMRPSHQREYANWIAGAKQEATIARRIAKAVEQIADGKSQNWKYEKR